MTTRMIFDRDMMGRTVLVAIGHCFVCDRDVPAAGIIEHTCSDCQAIIDEAEASR